MPEMVNGYSKRRVQKYKTLIGEPMHITYHAGERFLQRVFGFTSYSTTHIKNAIRLLERDLFNLQLRNKHRVPLPSFPNFYGVFQEDTLVTVIPKRINATL